MTINYPLPLSPFAKASFFALFFLTFLHIDKKEILSYQATHQFTDYFSILIRGENLLPILFMERKFLKNKTPHSNGQNKFIIFCLLKA